MQNSFYSKGMSYNKYFSSSNVNMTFTNIIKKADQSLGNIVKGFSHSRYIRKFYGIADLGKMFIQLICFEIFIMF